MPSPPLEAVLENRAVRNPAAAPWAWFAPGLSCSQACGQLLELAFVQGWLSPVPLPGRQSGHSQPGAG